MKRLLFNKHLLASILLLLSPLAFGLSTDKDQDIEILANTAELDDLKNISIYRGNVVVTQGSIRMTGDKMTVYNNDNNQVDVLIMEGRPATYRQLPDNSSVYDEAEALTLEFRELQNLIILIKEAEVRQEGSVVRAERIEYDTEISQVKAWNNPTADGNTATNDEKDDDRVQIIIKNKPEQNEGTE